MTTQNTKPVPSPYVIPEDAEGAGAYSEKELALLGCFKEKDDLLKLVRKVFWQEPLSEEQVRNLRSVVSSEVVEVLVKLFHPRFSSDDGIMDIASRWLVPQFSQNLTREVKSHVLARQDSVKFIDEGLRRLRDIVEGTVRDVALRPCIDIQMRDDYENTPEDEVRRAVIAHQESLTFLESRLVQIRLLADKKKETVAERAERLKKDSAR